MGTVKGEKEGSGRQQRFGRSTKRKSWSKTLRVSKGESERGLRERDPLNPIEEWKETSKSIFICEWN